MKCIICVKVIKENPGIDYNKLFPLGYPSEVEVMINGTGYCEDHIPTEKPPQEIN